VFKLAYDGRPIKGPELSTEAQRAGAQRGSESENSLLFYTQFCPIWCFLASFGKRLKDNLVSVLLLGAFPLAPGIDALQHDMHKPR